MKSIEIYYDIADIPGLKNRASFSGEALGFRNDAMEHIENALLDAGAGEWEGAEIGAKEINFGFSVEDFDRAEAIVRDCVAGTRFVGIREISRCEMSDEELEELAANQPSAAEIPFKFRVVRLIGFALAPIVLIGLVLGLGAKALIRGVRGNS